MVNRGEKHIAFLEHLEELRWTLVWIAVATALGTGVAWYFSSDMLAFLSTDLNKIAETALGAGQAFDLHVFEVGEAFTTRLKVALLMGFLIGRKRSQLALGLSVPAIEIIRLAPEGRRLLAHPGKFIHLGLRLLQCNVGLRGLSL